MKTLLLLISLNRQGLVPTPSDQVLELDVSQETLEFERSISTILGTIDELFRV
ncbi:MAG: hypothetical protein WCC12_20275 [Anaerolineales bacterium]